jgi:DNA-binding PadR family transcriptional regulator
MISARRSNKKTNTAGSGKRSNKKRPDNHSSSPRVHRGARPQESSDPNTPIDELARVLSKRIAAESFNKKYAPVKEVLTLVGAGAFLAASVAIPNLPKALKPFLNNDEDYNSWKRFNIPYLKRTLRRLERQKLIETRVEEGKQVVKITENGRIRILRYALDELEIKKPPYWNGKWYLVSYDIPEDYRSKRFIFADYLKAWRFYPLHLSVYLHAYPEAIKAVDFLRSYLRLTEHVRVFSVEHIENDVQFREFFGV